MGKGRSWAICEGREAARELSRGSFDCSPSQPSTISTCDFPSKNPRPTQTSASVAQLDKNRDICTPGSVLDTESRVAEKFSVRVQI